MKKLLTLTVLIAVASASYGQGLVNFFNGNTTKISTNSVVGGPATGPTLGTSAEVYYYGLFRGANGATDPNTFTFTGVYATNTSTSGRLLSDNGGQPSITGFAAGSTVDFLVRGWSANIGHDWVVVQAYLLNPSSPDTFYGQSGIADGYILGSAGSPPQNLFGPATGAGGGQLAPFTLGLLPVPEPSTFALAGLGAAALLIFRRRKQ